MKQIRLRGCMTRSDTPNWEPLLNLIRVYVDDFMWMFEVELKNGTRLHAYKHRETRRYLHLSEDGRAFVYEEPSFYREFDDIRRLVDLVLPNRCIRCTEQATLEEPPDW
jgi:hypothetical protein